MSFGSDLPDSYDAWRTSGPHDDDVECIDECNWAQDEDDERHEDLTADGHLPECPCDPGYEPDIPCRCPGDHCYC